MSISLQNHECLNGNLSRVQRQLRGAIPEMAVENGTILAFEAWQHVWSSARLALWWRQRNKWVKVSKEMWTRMVILWEEEFKESWWTGSSVKAEPCQFLQLQRCLEGSKCTRNTEWVKEEGKKGVGREGGKYSSLCYQEGDGYSLRQNPGWNSPVRRASPQGSGVRSSFWS